MTNTVTWRIWIHNRMSKGKLRKNIYIFRVVEKAHCLYLVGHGWGSFLFVWIAVVVGLIIFIEIWKRLWTFAQIKLKLE